MSKKSNKSKTIWILISVKWWNVLEFPLERRTAMSLCLFFYRSIYHCHIENTKLFEISKSAERGGEKNKLFEITFKTRAILLLLLSINACASRILKMKLRFGIVTMSINYWRLLNVFSFFWCRTQDIKCLEAQRVNVKWLRAIISICFGYWPRHNLWHHCLNRQQLDMR